MFCRWGMVLVIVSMCLTDLYRTGVKSLHKDQVASLGDLVVDMHAEVVAKRSFQRHQEYKWIMLIEVWPSGRFLNAELSKLMNGGASNFLEPSNSDIERDEKKDTELMRFRLKKTVTLHLYVSCAPCKHSLVSLIEYFNVEQRWRCKYGSVHTKLLETRRPSSVW
jgi:hypothetical protein